MIEQLWFTLGRLISSDAVMQTLMLLAFLCPVIVFFGGISTGLTFLKRFKR